MNHGGNLESVAGQYGLDLNSIIDFSSNILIHEYPLWNESDIKHFFSSIGRYPDPQYKRLKKGLGQYYQLDPEQIHCGNGAMELISLIFQVIQPDKTLIPVPVFSEYEKYSELYSGETIIYHLQEENDFKLTPENINEIADMCFDFLILCQPNNPSGLSYPEQAMVKLLEICRQKKAWVLIDESFLDLSTVQYSLLKYTKTYDNLLVLRSMTKLLGIPGCRMGFIASHNQEILSRLQNLQPCWSVNSVALEMTLFCLSRKESLWENLSRMQDNRYYFYEQLSGIKNLKVYPGEANFFLVKIKNGITAPELKKKLLNHRVLIRDCSNFTGLDSRFFRIAVKTRNENDLIISFLIKEFE